MDTQADKLIRMVAKDQNVSRDFARAITALATDQARLLDRAANQRRVEAELRGLSRAAWARQQADFYEGRP